MSTKVKLSEGTRIYTTGDRANPSGEGTVIKAYSDNYGSYVDLKMDDDREIRYIYQSAFSPEFSGNCSTRFVTLEAYKRYRKLDRTSFSR